MPCSSEITSQNCKVIGEYIDKLEIKDTRYVCKVYCNSIDLVIYEEYAVLTLLPI